MYAITARYLGATDHRGSRFVVRWGDLRAIVSYDYAAHDAGKAAIVEALATRPDFADQYLRAGAPDIRLAYGTDAATGATVAVVIR
jgi:hypothetical protein